MNRESKNTENEQCTIPSVISRFAKFLYWFIHNKIATPLLIVVLIIMAVVFSPFYLIWNYFYRYYCWINGL